ncbi:hypothetical protein [Streptococcus oricebi]|uniref:DUF4240 domain-containing protein n=1 Tax=Streptococcus oricebi TaxID=1547447 RepID=A0ABS5B4S7_9STRE|nr:hypothetical protein [Streptococcus oricebi]MBP2622984.1 hypothetical protein [Streptococcus oricebi]
MRLYIKSDFTKKINFGYEELAHKMWFETREGQELSLSHEGNDEMLQEDCYILLCYDKWISDKQWDSEAIKALHSFFVSESIFMEFEKAYISDYREKGDALHILSSHRDILTVDKRALYIMAIEVASALDGQISEDDKTTWLTVEEFQKKHQDILSLTFEEANDMSLKEVFTMEDIDEPLWDELDKGREEYIKIYGEREWDDDDEEPIY